MNKRTAILVWILSIIILMCYTYYAYHIRYDVCGMAIIVHNNYTKTELLQYINIAKSENLVTLCYAGVLTSPKITQALKEYNMSINMISIINQTRFKLYLPDNIALTIEGVMFAFLLYVLIKYNGKNKNIKTEAASIKGTKRLNK